MLPFEGRVSRADMPMEWMRPMHIHGTGIVSCLACEQEWNQRSNMKTTEKKQGRKLSPTLLAIARIQRELERHSPEERIRILQFCLADVNATPRGSAMPEWGDGARGPDRLVPLSQ